MQKSADHRSRRRHVSRMTDEKGETWSPSGMSKVRSRPESLVADCPICIEHYQEVGTTDYVAAFRSSQTPPGGRYSGFK